MCYALFIEIPQMNISTLIREGQTERVNCLKLLEFLQIYRITIHTYLILFNHLCILLPLCPSKWLISYSFFFFFLMDHNGANYFFKSNPYEISTFKHCQCQNQIRDFVIFSKKANFRI